MGTDARQSDGFFFMEAAHKADAFRACKHLYGSWVKAGETKNTTTLAEVLGIWGYEIKEDADGNITRLWFDQEKLGDEKKVWDAIAPFVRNDSFIEMSTPDGAFRWVFKNGKCTVLEATWADGSSEDDDE